MEVIPTALGMPVNKYGIDKSIKYDTGKLRFDLIDPFFEKEIAEVLTFGAAKYAPNNWQNLEDGIDRHYAALLRHLNAWRRGESIDDESGMPHLWHAATNMMFLCYHCRDNKENV